MRRLFKKSTIGGWASIGAFGYMIFFYLDTGEMIFLYISLPILALALLWIFAGYKEKEK